MNTVVPVDQIRFLPMSAEEFDTLDKTRAFLSTTMRERDGKYYYRRRNIILNGEALVLFQYGGSLIGSAIMTHQVSDERIINNIKYRGYYKFDVATVKIFAAPITAQDYKTIDCRFHGFNQSTRKTDMLYYNDICSMIDTHI